MVSCYLRCSHSCSTEMSVHISKFTNNHKAVVRVDILKCFVVIRNLKFMSRSLHLQRNRVRKRRERKCISRVVKEPFFEVRVAGEKNKRKVSKVKNTLREMAGNGGREKLETVTISIAVDA